MMDQIRATTREQPKQQLLYLAGILVAAALLSGLLSIIGSETAIAQQNMTYTNATAMNSTETLVG
jgi:hypothetical protein